MYAPLHIEVHPRGRRRERDRPSEALERGKTRFRLRHAVCECRAAMNHRDLKTQPASTTEPTSPSTELTDDQLEQVSGGTPKKGEKQQEYLIIKMQDIIVTG
jgi:bacteriocin-like protein